MHRCFISLENNRYKSVKTLPLADCQDHCARVNNGSIFALHSFAVFVTMVAFNDSEKNKKKSVLTEKRIFFRRNSSELKSALFRFFPPTRKMILENPFVLNLQLFFSFPFSLILHLPSIYFSFCFDPLFYLYSLLSFKFFNSFLQRSQLLSLLCALSKVLRSFK